MEWSEAVNRYIQALKPIQADAELAKRVCQLVDLTSLNSTDTSAGIAAFCQKAQTVFGHVAAVCVYPQFVRLVADTLSGTSVKTATVVNFPDGAAPLEEVLIQIEAALTDGAQEIDMVFPYERYLAGERQCVLKFVQTCKAACGHRATFKVILETGVLQDITIIADAAYDMLVSGADFIKTSTGKIAEGATLEAAATMLLVIKHVAHQLKHPVGLKVSGGIRTLEQAAQYIQLAEAIMGSHWVAPGTFRIGASKVIDEIEASFAHH